MELTFSHRYIKNTTTCGITLIELLLNAGRPQTSKRARKPPYNWAWQKKEEQKENGLWVALCLWEGAVEEERFLHARKSPH